MFIPLITLSASNPRNEIVFMLLPEMNALKLYTETPLESYLIEMNNIFAPVRALLKVSLDIFAVSCAK